MPDVPPPDLDLLSDTDLARQALAAWKVNRFETARALMSALCQRYTERSEAIPPGTLSFYAACLAERGKLKQAVDTCRAAARRDPNNPTVMLNLARVYLVAGSRRRALDAVDRGLLVAPRSPDLLGLRHTMGERKSPVVGFLSRDNPVNIALGRARHKLKKTPGKSRT